MLKDKINYKLVNIAIIALIIFLIYQTGNLWMGVVSKTLKIITPFFIAFIVAYALHPFFKFLTNHKLPKSLAILIIVCLVIGVFGFIAVMVVPLLFSQLTSLFNGIIAFIKQISIDSDINLGPIQKSLSTSFNDIIFSLGKYVSNGAVNVIGVSLGYISIAVIAFSASLYFLADMDMIRKTVGNYLKKKSKRIFKYVSLLDEQMKLYLTGFIRIMLITVVEYTLAYTIIGHPNAILLGFLAMIANLIPYFGGMITNVVAAITAFVISPTLFVKTVITFVILSAVDGYLINPLVYGKTNEVHPLVVILSVFAGGILFGIAGIVISLPLAIIIITTFKFFREDISDKIEDIKGSTKKIGRKKAIKNK